MTNKNNSLLAITNLYPVPWAPNRASFNKQQFELLGQKMAMRTMVLVPWREWLKHRQHCTDTAKLSYAPYFQLPGFGRSATPWFQRLAIASKQRWINQAPPSHIVASWAFPDAVACLMYAKGKPIDVVVKAHGTDVNEHTLYPKRKKIMATWLNQAKTVFCASQALKQRLIDIGVNSSKVTTNYNGVDSTVFYPQATSPDNGNGNGNGKRLLFVGNLIETKGVFELLDAFKQIASQTACTLHYIGQGNAADTLQKQIQQANLTQRVFLHGSLPLQAVAEQIRKSTVLVLPSHREGVPNVLLEACASGIPVVATTVGGIPEIVTPATGILVEPKNSNALATAMSSALARTWRKEEIVKHAANYNWQQNINNFLARI